TNDRFRRISPIPTRSGEGLLLNPQRALVLGSWVAGTGSSCLLFGHYLASRSRSRANTSLRLPLRADTPASRCTYRRSRLAFLLLDRTIHFAEDRHQMPQLSRKAGRREDRTARNPG